MVPPKERPDYKRRLNHANESPEEQRQRHENRNQRDRDTYNINRANDSPEQRHENRNQRGRNQRENETPDEQLARQQHRNERDYARREASGEGRYDRHRQLVDAERRAWSVTSEEFFRELEEKKGTFWTIRLNTTHSKLWLCIT